MNKPTRVSPTRVRLRRLAVPDGFFGMFAVHPDESASKIHRNSRCWRELARSASSRGATLVVEDRSLLSARTLRLVSVVFGALRQTAWPLRMAGRTVAGTFTIVRPYPGNLGKAVEALVSALGLTPALGLAPAPGTSDEQTARWLSRSTAQLLVVPFHFHRGADQSRLDGIGALLALPPGADFAGRVLFMPVRGFSWTTSFQPRYDLLKSERPRIAEQLIVAEEGELESNSVLVRVKRALETAEERRTRPPSRRPGARTPTSGDALHRLAERFSLPPPSEPRRPSGAWKFNPPEEVTVEETFGTVPPTSGARMILDEPAGMRPIYQDFIDKKKSSG